jgi:hypothetical protein
VIDARTHLESLVGTEIHTLTNRQPNRILGVVGDEVIVATGKSPNGRAVPVQWVQDGIDLLMSTGEVAVNVRTLGHRGAFVGAVLATLPGSVVQPTVPRRVTLAPRG